MMNFNSTAERLKLARTCAGFRTAKEFADKHDIPQPTYAQYEGTGKSGRELTLNTAREYAAHLGNCSAAWLLTGEGEAPEQKDPAPTAAQKERSEAKTALEKAITKDPDHPQNNRDKKFLTELREEQATFEGPDNADELLKALYPAHPRAAWIKAGSMALNLRGILPGDYLVYDPDITFRPGVDVVLQVADPQTGSAKTLLRHFTGASFTGMTSLSKIPETEYAPDHMTVYGVIVRVYRESS